MTRYSAQIVHSKETVQRFTRVQYGTFEFTRKLGFFLVSILLILFGVSQLARSSLPGIAALLVGCLLLTNLNNRAESIAERVAEAMQGRYSTLRYTFMEETFTDGEGRPAVPYSSLYCLIADEQYLYLFTGKATGYMFPAASVLDAQTGSPSAEELKRFLAQQSGLRWARPLSLLNFSLKDCLTLLRRRA